MEFSGSLRGRDFSNQDLTGAVFREADLYQVRFDRASLVGASFLNCFAAEAVFSDADCSRLRAIHTSFYRGNLAGARLREALLWSCVLSGADLRGADLQGITVTLDCNSFEDVELDRVTGLKLAYLVSRSRFSLRDSLLESIGERDRVWLSRVFAR